METKLSSNLLTLLQSCWNKTLVMCLEMLTVLTEWSSLKLLISETYSKAIPYQDVWTAIFSSPASKLQFSNILNIIELLLITPISNAVVERMFSTKGRMKSQLRNRMSWDRLDSLLRISKDGLSVKEYNSTVAIDWWYGQKKWRLGFGGHAYPEKQKKKNDMSVRHSGRLLFRSRVRKRRRGFRS